MLQTRPPAKAPWPQCLATWLLASLVLSAVHGLGIGIFLGLAIATGYLAAVHWRPLQMRGRLQRPQIRSRSREPDVNAPSISAVCPL